MHASLKAFAMGAAALIGASMFMPVRAAEDPAYLTIGAGSWETLRNRYREPELDLAYRSDYQLWIFKPHAGVLVAGDGDFVVFGGLLSDIYWGPHIVTTFSTSVAGWGGNGYDLGSHVDFRSGVDVAWRFEDTSRIGVGFYHVSNAGLTHRNGGSESLLLNYSLPLREIFSKEARQQTAALPSPPPAPLPAAPEPGQTP